MRSDAWASALSWCNIQVWFSHNSGLFLPTASLKCAKTSWYNCLFTIWPHGANSWWTVPFQSKKHNQHHLGLCPTHPCFFWLRRPFPHPLQRLHPGFNIISINPRLISCYDVLKKVFITICIGKQFVTDFNVVLSISQQIQHEFCTDLIHVKFFSKNLMAIAYADAHFISDFLYS